VSLGGPPAGIAYDVRMRPDNPDVMFVTDDGGGVFKSIDGGQTWFAANEGIGTDVYGARSIFSLTIDPHDYDTIWAGTRLSGHLYRSTDNGATWEARDAGITRTVRSVRGITVDWDDPNLVYLGVEVGTAESGGEVYRSTDAGLHWTRIWEGISLARYVWIDPRDTDRLYVSTGVFDREALNTDQAKGEYGGLGIVRSDDGGSTWEVISETRGLDGLFVPSLFMHPEDPDVLLAAASIASAPGTRGVYLTEDGADNWTRNMTHTQGVEAVEITEADTDIWYAAAEG